MSDATKKDKTFSHWGRDDLFYHFGLKSKDQCDLLDAWLAMEEDLSQFELDSLVFLRRKASKMIDMWKEADLRDNFLSPLINLANFHSEELRYTTFSESYISTSYHAITLKGNLEWMVAMGFENPRMPFFFIHEYKPSSGGTDAKGQLLSAMMTAQALNKTPNDKYLPYPWIEVNADMPIYGCSVIGQLWWFGVLHEEEYCFSRAYDSVDEKELVEIFKLLKAQKTIINRQIQKMTKR